MGIQSIFLLYHVGNNISPLQIKYQGVIYVKEKPGFGFTILILLLLAVAAFRLAGIDPSRGRDAQEALSAVGKAAVGAR